MAPRVGRNKEVSPAARLKQLAAGGSTRSSISKQAPMLDTRFVDKIWSSAGHEEPRAGEELLLRLQGVHS